MAEENQAVETQPVFSIEKIYVKDLSLEVPHAPQVFLTNESPEVEMKVATRGDKIEDGFYNFKLLDDNKLELYNQYLQSKSELTYVQWLEGRLLEGR